MFKLFLTCTFFLCLPVLSAAVPQLEGNCGIRFYGDSTLHGFEGTGACQPFVLTDASTTDGPLRVVVRVTDLDTDNDSRDEKMREMFEAEKFPVIAGKFKGLDPAEKLSSWLKNSSGMLEFDLTIRNVTRPVAATVSKLETGAAMLEFSLEFEVSLEDFSLEAPSVLGFIRVADRVRVEVDAEFSGDAGAMFPGAGEAARP